MAENMRLTKSSAGSHLLTFDHSKTEESKQIVYHIISAHNIQCEHEYVYAMVKEKH